MVESSANTLTQGLFVKLNQLYNTINPGQKLDCQVYINTSEYLPEGTLLEFQLVNYEAIEKLVVSPKREVIKIIKKLSEYKTTQEL